MVRAPGRPRTLRLRLRLRLPSAAAAAALVCLAARAAAPAQCQLSHFEAEHLPADAIDDALAGGVRGGHDVPTVVSLYPPAGHVAGGARVTVAGARFARSQTLRARFASENELDEVPCTFVSKGEVVCVAPPRDSPAAVQVTLSNDGEAYSAAPLVYVKGAGTSAVFTYDDSPPGCRGCGAQGFQRHLHPEERLRELWVAQPAAGPLTGGTRVLVAAKGVAWPNGTRVEGVTAAVPVVGQRYEGPSGGPGAPRPGAISRGAQPPQGTFYPGRLLTCVVECADAAGASASSLRPAEWHDYDRAACIMPPHPCLGSDSGERCDDETANCTLCLSNDGGLTLDHGFVGSEPGADELGNKAAVAFSYDPVLPYVDTVTTNTTSAGALQGGDGSGVASLPQRLGVARGPFDAHTRVIVTGRDFLASSNFRLRFNGTDGWSETVTGRVINSTHAVASAPRKLLPEMLPRLTGVTIEPCVLATVEASNDGVEFSARGDPSLHRFLYCDIYVSPTGSDEVGLGMPNNPLRTLQAALDAGLPRVEDELPVRTIARKLAVRAGNGGARGVYFNTERIVVLPGVYSGAGNKGLDPRGKVVVLSVARAGVSIAPVGRTVIDCEGEGDRAAQGVHIGQPPHPLPDRGALQIDGGLTTRDCGSSGVWAPGALQGGAHTCPAGVEGCGGASAYNLGADVYGVYRDY